jgi:hypothetical protein
MFIIENILVPSSCIYQNDNYPLLDCTLNPPFLSSNLYDLLAAVSLINGERHKTERVYRYTKRSTYPDEKTKPSPYNRSDIWLLLNKYIADRHVRLNPIKKCFKFFLKCTPRRVTCFFGIDGGLVKRIECAHGMIFQRAIIDSSLVVRATPAVMNLCLLIIFKNDFHPLRHTSTPFCQHFAILGEVKSRRLTELVGGVRVLKAPSCFAGTGVIRSVLETLGQVPTIRQEFEEVSLLLVRCLTMM